MALGTITIAKGTGQPSANLYVDTISFAGDGSYPTGGSAFKAAFQAKAGDAREPIAVIANDCGGYVPVYDPATGKLKLYQGDSDGVADGPLVQVPNATNLAAVTFNVVVLSQ